MRISVFKFGKKKVMGKTRQAKNIRLRAHTKLCSLRDRLTADIRQEMPTQVMWKAGVPHRATAIMVHET